MSGGGQELFNSYVLEILASAEKSNHTLEDLVSALRVKAQLADLRFEQIEQEVVQLRKVIGKVHKQR